MNLFTITERIAKKVVAATAEKEVERLLKQLLPGTPWAGRAHAVGGYVRDEVMGLESNDLDIVVDVNGGAEAMTKYLHGLFPEETSNAHQMGTYPIWEIVFKKDVVYERELFQTAGAEIQFADTMKEEFPDPTSRQRVVKPATLEEDIARRDFATNMLLKDMTTGEIFDLTGISRHDIEKGILRGHPSVPLDKMFSDDPLRLVRFVRFQVKYGWKVPMEVLRAVRRNAKRIEVVPAERIKDELEKIMELGKTAQAVRIMKATGLLQYILPEVQDMIGVQQPKQFHAEGDVFRHTLSVLKHAPPTIEGQLAALLHDVGKPMTQEIVGEAIKFHGHADTGAEIAEAVLRRLKFPSDKIKSVVTIVRNHMRPYELMKVDDKSIRRFVRDVGDETVEAIMDMAAADELGSLPVRQDVPLVRERVKKVMESPIPIKRQPVLNGKEIMSILGIGPEDRARLPEIGVAGRFLLEVADDYAARGLELTKNQATEILKDQVAKGQL